jgi:hypothetical protein
MKFDIFINGARLDSWYDAMIALDAQFSTSANFAIHSAGPGPWITNLSKVRIDGRECRAEVANWGFEEASDLAAWQARGECSPLRLDATESAYGIGSAATDWTPATQTAPVEFVHSFAWPENGNGFVFWGWFSVTYATTAKPALYVLAYAKDAAGNEWTAPARVLIPETHSWAAAGLRLAPTQVQPLTPAGLTEFGFRVTAAEDVPLGALLATLRLDSIWLCGRTYPAGIQLPPFAADSYAGSLAPFQPLTCKKWDQSTWEDGANIANAQWAWCPQGTAWDGFLWADEAHPSSQDSQWA